MAIDKNKIIEAATKFVQKGQYDKAIKEYNKLLEVDPKDGRILQKLGELYQKKGENDQAAECFMKVAESYSADGFFLKAVAVFKQVLKLNPNLIEVNLKLAELHQQLGLMSDAMAQFQLVANHYDKIGDTKASLDTLRKMVELDPDNIASRIKLAELYAREQMNEEAIDEFRRCADYLKNNNRVDDYLKVAERLVFLDPSDLSLTRELANIYLAKQDTKRALAKLQLCFKADPKDVDTLTMLAQAFKDLGQLSKTVSVYKELAKIYDEQDKIDEERAIWKKILELAPDDADARAKVAPKPTAPEPVKAPAQQPQKAGGPAQPGRAAPTAKLSAEQIAKLLTETDVYVKYGLHDKALDHLKKVFAAEPDSIDGHEKAIALSNATNNSAAAMESLVKVIRLCIGKGDLDRARGHIQTLCEKDPMHADVQEFLEAVGGLGAAEEVAEIEEEAILVEAADEVVEVAEEPENVIPQDIGLSAAEVSDEVEESLTDEPLASSDDAEESLASSDDGLIAEPGGPDEDLIAEPPADSDALAIDAASESSEEVVEEEPAELPVEELADEPLGAGADELPDEPLPVDESAEVVDDAEAVEDMPFDTGPSDDADADAFGPETVGQPTTLLQRAFVPPIAAKPEPEDFAVEEEAATRITDLRTLMREAEEAKVAEAAKKSAEGERKAAEAKKAEDARKADEARRAEDARRAEEKRAEKARAAAEEARRAAEAAAAEAEAAPAEETTDGEDPAGDELDEAAFFIEQGELDEAREILETVSLAFPNSKRTAELMVKLEAKERGDAPPAEEAAPEGGVPETTDGGFDLAAELTDEDFGDLGEEPAPKPPDEEFQYSVEDVFEEFKKGVQKVVKPEDVDTHYDLGIAYKEMGLVEDAIGEFEQALKGAIGKKKEVECLTMIGMCRSERGEYEKANEAYKRGLNAELVSADALKALHFEIGTTYEKMEKLKEALQHFLKVETLDPRFREVTAIVARLKVAVPGGVSGSLDDDDDDEATQMAEPVTKVKAKPANGAANGAAAAKPDDGAAKGKPGKSSKIGYL